MYADRTLLTHSITVLGHTLMGAVGTKPRGQTHLTTITSTPVVPSDVILSRRAEGSAITIIPSRHALFAPISNITRVVSIIIVIVGFTVGFTQRQSVPELSTYPVPARTAIVVTSNIVIMRNTVRSTSRPVPSLVTFLAAVLFTRIVTSRVVCRLTVHPTGRSVVKPVAVHLVLKCDV